MKREEEEKEKERLRLEELERERKRIMEEQEKQRERKRIMEEEEKERARKKLEKEKEMQKKQESLEKSSTENVHKVEETSVQNSNPKEEKKTGAIFVTVDRLPSVQQERLQLPILMEEHRIME